MHSGALALTNWINWIVMLTFLNRASWFIAVEVGVSSIPVSEVCAEKFLHHTTGSHHSTQFYCQEHVSLGESYIRFSFCKDLDTLKAAGERLQKLKKYLA